MCFQRQKGKFAGPAAARGLVAAFGFFWLAAAAVAAPGLTAALDRNVMPVGESVTLSLTFEGAAPDAALTLPALPNLSVQAVAQSKEVTIVNGQQTSRVTFNYTLVATQPGDVVIPGLQVNVGGRAVVSQPLALKIVPAAAAANAAGGLAQYAFMKLIVPKTEVYVGEPFPVEIHLYFQSVRDVQMPQLKAAGFSLGQSAKPSQTQTQVGNVGYNLAVFKMSATAARAGNLTLGPAECSLTVLVPVTNQRSRDPFANFFGAPAQARPTVLASDSHVLRVLPLPAQNVPPGFSGAVGSYQLQVTAGPTNVAVGDPITVKVQIIGNGLLDALALPAQPQWREFKTYPPTSKVDTTDPLGLSGQKSFEQVVIPQNHEVQALPSFQFSFFDPNQKAYRTLSNRPIALTVRPSATTPTPLPSLTNGAPGAPAPVDDIVHIHDRLAVSRPPAPLLAQQPWFFGLQGVPLLGWLALRYWRKRTEALANNPRLRRQRQVAQRLREGLVELRRQAEAQQAEAFFATLFRLLQEQLGERLDLPASAITEAVIEERLRGSHLPKPAVRELHDLFQVCNLARYAPHKSSQELAALIPRLEGVLRELQQLPQDA